jgi:transposase
LGLNIVLNQKPAEKLNVSRKTISKWKSKVFLIILRKFGLINGLTFKSRTNAAAHFGVHIETIRNWLKIK